MFKVHHDSSGAIIVEESDGSEWRVESGEWRGESGEGRYEGRVHIPYIVLLELLRNALYDALRPPASCAALRPCASLRSPASCAVLRACCSICNLRYVSVRSYLILPFHIHFK